MILFISILFQFKLIELRIVYRIRNIGCEAMDDLEEEEEGEK